METLLSPMMLIDKVGVVHAIYEQLVNKEFKCFYNIFIRNQWLEPILLNISNYGNMDNSNRYFAFSVQVLKLKSTLIRQQCL